MTTPDTSEPAHSHSDASHHHFKHAHSSVDPLDQRSFWNEAYADHGDSKWSGKANGSLVTETSDLSPGRALDIGCGEGADAIWLARRGWHVTGLDVSDVAIERAGQAADDAGVEVEFRVGDIVAEPPAAESYDLITFCYPSILRSGAETFITDLATALVPGGTLLVLGHDQFDPAIVEGHGIDIDQFLSIEDIAEAMAAAFEIDLDEVRRRPDQPEDNPHSHDRVLRARKPERSSE